MAEKINTDPPIEFGPVYLDELPPGEYETAIVSAAGDTIIYEILSGDYKGCRWRYKIPGNLDIPARLKLPKGFPKMTENPKDSIGATKVPVTLVPPAAIIYCAMALRDGARKYGAYNWRKAAVIMSIYLEALLRHAMCVQDGEDVAEDSLCDHLGHVIACCAIILDARACNRLIDDRPLPGPASHLLKELNTFIKEHPAPERMDEASARKTAPGTAEIWQQNFEALQEYYNVCKPE